LISCLGGALAILVGQGSAGAASTKPFAVVICSPSYQAPNFCTSGNPQVISPGLTNPANPTVVANITDETTKGAGLTIGSVNLTAPTGVTITSASLGTPPGTPIAACTSTTPTSTSCIASGGSVLELRGLNVPPSGSIELSMGLDTPPPPSGCTTATPCQWTAAAKQSNDYNGPPGNALNLDSSSSQLGIIVSAEATCASAKKANSCSTTLGDGGTAGSSAGSVNFTTDATGTSSGIFYQSIDYGPPLDSSTTGPCRGVDSDHDEYFNGPALEGSAARSVTLTITTTDYPGYEADVCAALSQPFKAKSASLATVALSGVPATLYSTTQLFTEADGTQDYEGLLPDCAGSPGATAPTVNCKSLPGILSRSTSTSADGTVLHTIVASIPPGFDSGFARN